MHRFSPEGKLLHSWGEPGSGPGQFMLPHGVWIDSRGRVLVADRENDRVQVFTQDGEFITQWPTKLSGPAAFWVDRDDVAYVPEHNSGRFSVLTLDGGINLLDTAACYGISEELIGRTIAHRRGGYTLATKCGHVTGGYTGTPWTAQAVRDGIERSLRRMNTDHLDLVQLFHGHRGDAEPGPHDVERRDGGEASAH